MSFDLTETEYFPSFYVDFFIHASVILAIVMFLLLISSLIYLKRNKLKVAAAINGSSLNEGNSKIEKIYKSYSNLILSKIQDGDSFLSTLYETERIKNWINNHVKALLFWFNLTFVLHLAVTCIVSIQVFIDFKLVYPGEFKLDRVEDWIFITTFLIITLSFNTLLLRLSSLMMNRYK